MRFETKWSKERREGSGVIGRCQDWSFWEVALLFGRLVDIDVSEEPPASMLWVEGALSEQKKKRNLSHSRLFM